MDIIKYIKNMFSSVFGKKTKMLEAKTTSQDENSEIKKNISKRKEFIENNREEINPKGLNFAINQYLNSLIYQLQNEGRVNSYNALVSPPIISSAFISRSVYKNSNDTPLGACPIKSLLLVSTALPNSYISSFNPFSNACLAS